MTQGGDGAGGTTVLEKNDKYWDKANVAVKRINGRIVKDTDTAINLYEAGELDITGLVGDKVAQYEDSPEFYRRVEPLDLLRAAEPRRAPAVTNLNIRKALMIGFDREALTEQILARTARCRPTATGPAGDHAGPGDQTFRQANGDLVPTDTSGARQLWEKGVEELGEPQLERCSFDDTAWPATMRPTFTRPVQGEPRADLEVEITTFEAGLDRVERLPGLRSTLGWIGDYDDPMTFLDLFLSDSPLNNSLFENEEYDGSSREAQTTSDLQLRMQMMLKAERILIDEAGTVPEFYSAPSPASEAVLQGLYAAPLRRRTTTSTRASKGSR